MRPLAAVLGLALAGSVIAADPGASVLQVLSAERVEVAGGGVATAQVRVRVKRGYHVQANPVLDAALIPITLTVEPSQALHVGEPRYPAPKRHRLQGADADLVVLDGGFAIEVPLRASAGAAPGPATLVGSLRYQACDHARCLFPRSVPVEIPVRIGSPQCVGSSPTCR